MWVLAIATASTPPPTPDWSLLHWFGIVFAGTAILVVLTYLGWCTAKKRNVFSTLWSPLVSQSSGWSFKDSWASNATLAGTVLLGFLGSTNALSTVFGDNAKNAAATITVAAAIGAALAVSAPLVLAATTRSGHNTAGGFLVAAVATVTGVAGELAVAAKAGETLDFGGYQRWLPWIGVIATLLLALYVVRSIPAILGDSLSRVASAVEDAAHAIVGLQPAEKADTNAVRQLLHEKVSAAAAVAVGPSVARSPLL
jgi:hypothetical protein